MRKKLITGLPILTGDETANVIFPKVLELFERHLQLDLIEFDGSAINRSRTQNGVIEEFVKALKLAGAGLKLPTITVGSQKKADSLGIEKPFESPNAALRRKLKRGPLLRELIKVSNLPCTIPPWTNHRLLFFRDSHGGMYDGKDAKIQPGDSVKVVIASDNGSIVELPIANFSLDGNGGAVLAHCCDTDSIRFFARASFERAQAEGLEVWLGTKSTISTMYHGLYVEVFDEVSKGYPQVTYRNMLIDALLNHLPNLSSNVLIATPNYEGDLVSDLGAGGGYSLGMMYGHLQAEGNIHLFDPAGGTAPDLLPQFLETGDSSYNPTVTVVCLAKTIIHLANLEGATAVADIATNIIKATVATIESGVMTPDLARLSADSPKSVTCNVFLENVAASLN